MNIFALSIFSLLCTSIYAQEGTGRQYQQVYESFDAAAANADLDVNDRILFRAPRPNARSATTGLRPQTPSDWLTTAEHAPEPSEQYEHHLRAMTAHAATVAQQQARIEAAERCYDYNMFTPNIDDRRDFSQDLFLLYNRAFDLAKREENEAAMVDYAKRLQDMLTRQVYTDFQNTQRIIGLDTSDKKTLKWNYLTKYMPVLAQHGDAVALKQQQQKQQASSYAALGLQELENNNPQEALKQFFKAHERNDSIFNVEYHIAELLSQNLDLRSAEVYAQNAFLLATRESTIGSSAYAQNCAKAAILIREIHAKIARANGPIRLVVARSEEPPVLEVASPATPAPQQRRSIFRWSGRRLTEYSGVEIDKKIVHH